MCALAALYVYIKHHRESKEVRLAAEPGNIAAAVSLTSQTELSYLLEGRDNDLQIREMLKGQRFRLDTNEGKIILETTDSTGSPTKSRFGADEELGGLRSPLYSPYDTNPTLVNRLSVGSKRSYGQSNVDFEEEKKRRMNRVSALYQRPQSNVSLFH